MDSLRAIAALAMRRVPRRSRSPALFAARSRRTSPRSSAAASRSSSWSRASCSTGRSWLAHAGVERLPDCARLRVAALPAHRPRVLGGGHRRRPDVRPGGLRQAAVVLRVRPDLLAGRGLRGHPACVDALHRGVVLRVPAAVRPSAARRDRPDRRVQVAVEATAIGVLLVFGLAWRAAGLASDSEFMRTSMNTLPAYLGWFAVGMGLAVASAWIGEGGAKPSVLRLVERAPGLCWTVAAAALAANAWIWDRRYLRRRPLRLRADGHPRHGGTVRPRTDPARHLRRCRRPWRAPAACLAGVDLGSASSRTGSTSGRHPRSKQWPT